MSDAESQSSAPRILLGSARSGTTWLQDNLALANGLRTSFEPLHTEAVPEARTLGYRYRPPEEPWPELERYLRGVLSGRGTRLWSDLRVRRDRFFYSPSLRRFPAMVGGRVVALGQTWQHLRQVRDRPILCKLIRANLLAGWLREQLGAHTLLLVRHPGAVVVSQRRTNPAYWHRPEDQLRWHLEDEALLRDHLAAERDLLERDLDPVELRTVLWCIENVVPIRQAAAWGLSVVHYESLLARDEAAWRRVLEALALDRLPEAAALDRPSRVASKDFKDHRPGAEAAPGIARWQSQLDDGQKGRIQAVLDRFGVTDYHCDDPSPRVRPTP